MPLSKDKDSLQNTFLVAISLCLVCALLVSSAAVGLKSMQDANALNDRQSNIVKVTGFTDEDVATAGGVGELFAARFETQIIDLETGQVAPEACQVAVEAAGKKVNNIVDDYDQIWCSKSKKESVSDRLDKKTDIVGIKYREKYAQVFTLKSEAGEIEKYVFPVRGYGLWSMMQGYMAVEPDLETVAGLTFYAQGETPGLGGEVTNPRWKAKWPGKEIYKDGEVALEVKKGDQSSNNYGVDALSGATITSNGVTNMVEFWMGERGYGPYIAQQKGSPSKPAVEKTEETKTEDSKSAYTAPAKSGENHG